MSCGETTAPVHHHAAAPAVSPATVPPVPKVTAPSPTTTVAAPVVDCGSSGLPGTSAAPATAQAPATPTTWPQHTLAVLPSLETISSTAVDVANRNAYSMETGMMSGAGATSVLERTDLSTGALYIGPTFPLGDLAVADDAVWVFGTVGYSSPPPLQYVACEVDPVTLSVIKSVSLPSPAHVTGSMAICTGPEGSVWIGYAQSLLRIDTATGAVLDRATVPAGLAVSDVAVDPSDRYLYVSFAHLVGSLSSDQEAEEGAAVSEYDATSGALLSSVTTGPIDDSINGAKLVAGPDGVWASFRTGMMGLTILLRQRDLATVAPPAAGPDIGSSVGDILYWTFSATVAYGDDTLFLAQDGGLVACLDPVTGTVRATEQLPSPIGQDDSISLLAVSSATGVVYGTDSNGLVRLTPPSSCWR